MTSQSPMPFGKYKGRKLVKVPAQYLLWLNMQEWFKASSTHDELKQYITTNRHNLQHQVMRERR